MSNPQYVPRSSTWEILTRSPNESAVVVLSAGLQVGAEEVRRQAMLSLLKRPELAARKAILANWKYLSSQDREHLRTCGKDLNPAARDIFSSGTIDDKRSLLDAANELKLPGILADLLPYVCNETHPLHEPACACMLGVCDHWGQLARSERDVPSARMPMLQTMYGSLANFANHECLIVVDAWLLLVNWDDSLQRGLMSDPRNEAYRPVLKRLGESTHPSILQLLGGYLWRSATPKSVLSILAERDEPELAIAIAKLLDETLTPIALRKLRDMPPMACFTRLNEQMEQVPLETRRRLWLMLAAASNDFKRILEAALKLAKAGGAEARATAAEMIRTCRKQDLEQLVVAIQTSTSSIGEDSSLGAAIEQLTGWLASPSLVLRKSASEFFQEFTLPRLLEKIRRWPTPLCRAMASIVKLTEEELVGQIVTEMQSPAPKRRMIALQATQLLDISKSVSAQLLPLLDDPRLDIRVRVIDVLSALGHEVLEDLMPQLLNDASTDIQEAAERARKRMQRRKSKSSLKPSPITP